jgi:hypothetical protein
VCTSLRAPTLSALVGASSGAMGSPMRLGENEKETSGTRRNEIGQNTDHYDAAYRRVNT